MTNYGTHNSLTAYPLRGWCRWIKPLLDLTSRCQSLTIDEQLSAGVRWFNLQVAFKSGRWIGSHGLAWYDVELLDVLNTLRSCGERVYVQLVYDNHIGCKRDREAFVELVNTLFIEGYIHDMIISAYIEGGEGECLYRYSGKLPTMEEHYWTLAWARLKADKWYKLYYYLPWPWLWAKLYNRVWESECKRDYLMLDFAKK